MTTTFILIAYWIVSIIIVYGIRYYNNRKSKTGVAALMTEKKTTVKTHLIIILFAAIILPVGALVLVIDAMIPKKHKNRYTPPKPKTKLELNIEENIPHTEYYFAAEALGNAMVTGEFSAFDSMLAEDVSLVLYENKSIYGFNEVAEYWKDWRERYVKTKKVLEFKVKFGANISRACLHFEQMLIMFLIENGKVKKMLLTPRLFNTIIGFHKADLLTLPMSVEYAKAHAKELDKEPFEKKNRIPCLCCGTPSEELEWQGFHVDAGIHGYSGKLSICPKCHRVVEVYPEIRMRFEEPQWDKAVNKETGNQPDIKLELTSTRYFVSSEPLKNSKYIEDLPEDVVFKFESPFADDSPEFGPCSVKQIAADCNWFLLREMREKDAEMYQRVKDCYEDAFMDGIDEAYNNLGILAFNYEDQQEEGLELLHTAAEFGVHNAMQNYFTALWGEGKNEEAIQYLCNIAKLSDISLRCLWNLAVLYCLGDGMEENILKQDFDKAKVLLQRIVNKEGADIKDVGFDMFNQAKILLRLIEESNDYSLKGQDFHELLRTQTTKNKRKKDKGEVFEVLSELSLPNGYCLGLKIADETTHDIGDESKFFLYNDKGETEKNVLKHLNVKATAMAAWEVYLLETSPTVMPVFWHGGYIVRTYIFSEADLEKIEVDWGQDNPERPLEGMDLSGLYRENLLLPCISINSNNEEDEFIADVYCTFWNDWKGLVREHVKITICNGKVKEYKEVGSLVIHPYDCGVFF